jgi:hypothetical protein
VLALCHKILPLIKNPTREQRIYNTDSTFQADLSWAGGGQEPLIYFHLTVELANIIDNVKLKMEALFMLRSPGLKKVLIIMGGVLKMAKLLNLSHSTVSSWNEIPPHHVLNICRISKVPCWELRPDLYERPGKYL